jgi:hypothetical protein
MTLSELKRVTSKGQICLDGLDWLRGAGRTPAPPNRATRTARRLAVLRKRPLAITNPDPNQVADAQDNAATGSRMLSVLPKAHEFFQHYLDGTV